MARGDEKVLVDGVVQQSFALKGCALSLCVVPNVLFVPNAVSRLFSKVVRIDPGDTVFDIGTGVGVLAIWAAMQPTAAVHAVDPVALQCEMAERNVAAHALSDKVRVYHGSLFDPLPAKLLADVIIGDVSGIADAPGKALGWYSDEVPTGGSDGTEVVTELIRRAPQHLAEGGRLYFPVAVGLSDDERVMEAAEESFAEMKRVVDVWFPLSEEEHTLCCGSLPPALGAKLQRRGSRMAWNGHIYEATSPLAPGGPRHPR